MFRLRNIAVFMGLSFVSCAQTPVTDTKGASNRVSSTETFEETSAATTIPADQEGVATTENAQIVLKRGSISRDVKVSVEEVPVPSAAKDYTAASKAQAIKVTDLSGTIVKEVTLPLEVSLNKLSSSKQDPRQDLWVLIVEKDGTKSLVLNPKVSNSTANFKFLGTDFTAIAVQAQDKIPSDVFIVDEHGVKRQSTSTTTSSTSTSSITSTTTASTSTTPTPTATPAPGAPTSLSATVASASQVNLSWTDNASNETAFEVQSSTDNSTWTDVSTSVSADATSLSVSSGLSANTSYYFRVRAKNSGGSSAYSTLSSAVTTLLATPTSVTVVPGDQQNTISWSSVSGATSYKVYYKTSSGVADTDSSLTTASASKDHTSLTTGQIVYYKVQALSGSNSSALSSEASGTPAATATKFRFATSNTYPTSVSAGASFGNSITVELLDASDNLSHSGSVTAYLLPFSDSSCTSIASGTKGGTWSGALTGAARTFSNSSTAINYEKAETIYLGVCDTSNCSGGTITKTCRSTGITVNPAGASALSFATLPSITESSSFSLTVNLVDTYGNVDTANSSAVTIAACSTSATDSSCPASTGTLSGTLTQSASSGVANFTGLSYSTAEDIKFRATTTSFQKASGTASVSNAATTSLTFDGSDDYVTASDASLPAGTTSRTIAMWINPTATAGEKCFFSYGSGSGGMVALDVYNGALLMTQNGSSINGGSISANIWQHVMYTYDGSSNTHVLYVNNTQVASSVGGMAFDTQLGGAIKIGNYTHTNAFFGGKVDDVRVYSKVLSSTERAEIYNSGEGLSTNAITGLVGWWKLDEGSGTTVADSSSSGRNGTLSNATWSYDAIPANRSLLFDGSNDRISIADSASISPTSAITMAAWVKPNATSAYQSIASQYTTGSQRFQLYLSPGGALGGHVSPDGSTSYGTEGVGTVAAGTWSHVALTFDGTTGYFRLYVNAVEVHANNTGYSSLYDTARALIIGSREITANSFDCPFNGRIDDVRMYSKALSTTELEQIYNSGSGRSTNSISDLAAWYKLDGSSTVAKDSSGNNHGTLTNDPAWNLEAIPSHPVALQSDLALWLKMNESSITNGSATYLDSSSAAKHSTPVNMASPTASVPSALSSSHSYCAATSGSSSYISIPTIAALNSATTFSVSYWFKLNSEAAEISMFAIMTGSNYSNDLLFAYTNSSGGVLFYQINSGADGSGNLSRSGNYTLGDWAHTAVVYDGTATGNANRMKVYLNGVQKTLSFDSGYTVPSTSASMGSPRMGYYENPGHFPFPGSLCDLRIFSRPLTGAEVSALASGSQ